MIGQNSAEDVGAIVNVQNRECNGKSRYRVYGSTLEMPEGEAVTGGTLDNNAKWMFGAWQRGRR